MAKGKLPLHLVAWVFVFVSASGGLGWSATQALSAQYQANVAMAATQETLHATATVMAERSARTVQIKATLIEPIATEQIVNNQAQIIPAHEAQPSLVEAFDIAPIVTIYPTVASHTTALIDSNNSSRLGVTHYTMPSSVTPQPRATDTPAPFELAPTVTSESPQATDIPIVVIVLEPTPTYAATATLEPTWTPAPTPRPTDIPKPTDAPVPTMEPTATEGVLVSPLATATSEPTAIP